MNKRIKELLEQAGVKYTVMPKDTVYEKFAELLVTECAMFVVVELEGQVGSLIADRTANRLEEHFGVIE